MIEWIFIFVVNGTAQASGLYSLETCLRMIREEPRGGVCIHKDYPALRITLPTT